LQGLGENISHLWGDKAGLLGFLLVGMMVTAALLAPWIAPHNPNAQSLSGRLLPPFWYTEGSTEHLMGTDYLGRDIFSRVIFGARTSISVATLTVLAAGTFGIAMGLLAGYNGRRTDNIIMRIVDIQLAIPGLLLAVIIITVLGASFWLLVLILAIDGWPVFARMTRGLVLSTKEEPYVQAADLLGCSPLRITVRHILPNLISPLTTLATLEFARNVIYEASLSFLGLGIQPPQISWGLDLSTGRAYALSAWWLVGFPGIAISITVLGLNLVASWLRIVSDPRERDKRVSKKHAIDGPPSGSRDTAVPTGAGVR
jgi:peptide/nickel transport system permease protein